MKKYTLANNVTGWIAFLVAAITYLLTKEPTVSFWDCGEFIASSYKLEVGHPPGAPFFMILARIFALFAGGNTSNVAAMINSMSALASAFTILFLFWTITHLAKKIISPNNELSAQQIIIIIGSGLVGALAYTFSDTFWFSAVEAEVYASSSLFTAVVFWAILKWENIADNKYANRWLVFIAFLIGLSIGVHLLNLLAIPAIVFVYYFKKFKSTTKGLIITSFVAMIILGIAIYGIIPGVPKVASKFELFFVNEAGLPYNSGIAVFFIFCLIFIVTGIIATHKPIEKSKIFYLISFVSFNFAITSFTTGLLLAPVLIVIYFITKKNIVKTLFIFYGFIIIGYILYQFLFEEKDEEAAVSRFGKVFNITVLCLTTIIIGYSTFAVILIRSSANPPMDENDPDNPFALLSYLNREQYGDRPLIYGPYFNSPIIGQSESYTYIQKNGKYQKIVQTNPNYKYDSQFMTLFPRMYSHNENHEEFYKSWSNIKGKPITVESSEGQKTEYCPTFSENLHFFFTYQIGYMYLRYFMWNFAGRQNDTQGHGGVGKGNWISGIDFIDNFRLGPQENMPYNRQAPKSNNKYFLLPLILGLLGLAFSFNHDKKIFTLVALLFFFTGIAIVIYLNQTPYQPRERDYAYAGSFYAFAIWIGFGVMSLFQLIKKYVPVMPSAVISVILCLILVPGIMAKENWNDHDRSGRYTALDMAKNYLNSCEKDAILFTYGDNDTFPLWYAQEVEGVRTDVRVVNLSLLGTEWYISQMKKRAYESAPVPISMTEDKYEQGIRDILPVVDRVKKPVNLTEIVKFISSDDPQTKIQANSGEEMVYIPTRQVFFPVDSAKVIANGTVKPEMASSIVKNLEWKISRNYYTKSDMIILDIIATNNWNRPIYFATSIGDENYLGLQKYFRFEGFALKLVPYITQPHDGDYGHIDTDILYNNVMNKFTWGRINEPDVYIDEQNRRNAKVMNIRGMFIRLAEKLIVENKKDSAEMVLDKIIDIMPDNKFQLDYFALPIVENYYKIDKFEKGDKIASIMANNYISDIEYFITVPENLSEHFATDQRIAMHVLNQLSSITGLYNRTDLSEKINKKLSMILGTPDELPVRKKTKDTLLNTTTETIE